VFLELRVSDVARETLKQLVLEPSLLVPGCDPIQFFPDSGR